MIDFLMLTRIRGIYGVLHSKETEDAAFGVFIEDSRPVLDVPDVLDGIEKIRVFPGDDGEQPGKLLSWDDHKDDTDGAGETTGTFYPGHAIAQRGEAGHESLRFAGSDEPDDHEPDRDKVLDRHAKHRPDTVACEIGKEIPELHQVSEDKSGRDQPYPGLDYPDICCEVCVSLADVNRPDRLKACLGNPGEKDKEGYSCCCPKNTDIHASFRS